MKENEGIAFYCKLGTWSHRGFSEIIGVGFVMEVYTGRALDVEVTEKCISGACKDRDKYRTTCPGADSMVVAQIWRGIML